MMVGVLFGGVNIVIVGLYFVEGGKTSVSLQVVLRFLSEISYRLWMNLPEKNNLKMQSRHHQDDMKTRILNRKKTQNRLLC